MERQKTLKILSFLVILAFLSSLTLSEAVYAGGNFGGFFGRGRGSGGGCQGRSCQAPQRPQVTPSVQKQPSSRQAPVVKQEIRMFEGGTNTYNWERAKPPKESAKTWTPASGNDTDRLTAQDVGSVVLIRQYDGNIGVDKARLVKTPDGRIAGIAVGDYDPEQGITTFVQEYMAKELNSWQQQWVQKVVVSGYDSDNPSDSFTISSEAKAPWRFKITTTNGDPITRLTLVDGKYELHSPLKPPQGWDRIKTLDKLTETLGSRGGKFNIEVFAVKDGEMVGKHNFATLDTFSELTRAMEIISGDGK